MDRKLELTIISAENLKDVRHLARMQARAVAWIDENVKYSTEINQTGGANPVWNDKFVFNVPPSYFLQNSGACLTIEIHSESLMGSKFVGKVTIPLVELDKGSGNSYELQHACYDVQRPLAQSQGKLYISYRLEPKSYQSSSDGNRGDTSPRSIIKKPLSPSSPSSRIPKKHVTFQNGTSLPVITNQISTSLPVTDQKEAITFSPAFSEIHVGREEAKPSLYINRQEATTFPSDKNHAIYKPKKHSIFSSSDREENILKSSEKEWLKAIVASPPKNLEEPYTLPTRIPTHVTPPHFVSTPIMPTKESGLSPVAPYVTPTTSIQRNLTMGSSKKHAPLSSIHKFQVETYHSLQPSIGGFGSLFRGDLGRTLLS
eukprot:c13427_g1_i1 orf=204-1319(+)